QAQAERLVDALSANGVLGSAAGSYGEVPDESMEAALFREAQLEEDAYDAIDLADIYTFSEDFGEDLLEDYGEDLPEAHEELEESDEWNEIDDGAYRFASPYAYA